MGFFLRRRRKGPLAEVGGENLPGFSQLLQVLFPGLRQGPGPAHGPKGYPVSTHVTSCPSDFSPVAAGAGGVLLLELRPEPKGSSPGLTWISVFLWGIQRGSQALSHVEPCKSAPS